MPPKRGPLTYITLSDDKHQPLGAVACGGIGWTLTCGQCPYACPSTDPGAAVIELLAHIDGAHGAAPLVEVVESSSAVSSPLKVPQPGFTRARSMKSSTA